MTRRGSVLPVECVQQLPTLLSTAVSRPAPKKRDHSIEWSNLKVVREIGLENYGTVKPVKNPQRSLL